MAFKNPFACLKCLIGGVVVVTAVGVAVLYSGWYPMGADVPHSRLTYWVLETLRERSIARASAEIEVPQDLATPDRLLRGGADYNDMCVGCHLKPGKTQSDFTLGLYPTPPNLTLRPEEPVDPQPQQRRRFWIIKHGIKASGMPAWGPGHDDERIWNMVAFLQRLPDLSAAEYQILTARDADSAHH